MLNGDSYKGEWYMDKKHGRFLLIIWLISITGQGIYVWKDKSQYEGAWEEDMRHGTGVYSVLVNSQLSTRYIGEWKLDKYDVGGSVL